MLEAEMSIMGAISHFKQKPDIFKRVVAMDTHRLADVSRCVARLAVASSYFTHTQEDHALSRSGDHLSLVCPIDEAIK
jgi:hypothetical protein